LWVGAWSGLAVFILIVAAGCSSSQRSYRVLSFFFDGVPNPSARHGGAAGSGGESEFGPVGAAPKLVGSVHPPFKDEKQCSQCHGNAAGGSFESFQTTKITSDVCLKCHKDKLTQFTWMHGPVTAVECLLCHQPHESSLPWLLKDSTPQVCVQCHDRDLLSASPREHQLPDSQCLKCHTGHGGPKHNFLRVDATIPKLRIPATLPSSQPPAAALATPTDGPSPGPAGQKAGA